MQNDLILGMAGAGGDGVITTGEILIEAAALEGRYAMLTKAYGPQIRGGESSFRLRLSENPVRSPGAELSLGVALNWPDFRKFPELQLGAQSLVLHDSGSRDELPAPVAALLPPESLLDAPIAELAKQARAPRSKNIVVLGILSAWTGAGASSLPGLLEQRFAEKGAEVVASNARAFAAGRNWAFENPPPWDLALPEHKPDGKTSPAPLLLADGNSMCGAGAIFAGCEFYGGYPITPASEIMHFFSEHVWKYDGGMLQMEDEIAGIGAALGASFSGKKAMTATSGPGMDLKSEILGLATMAELPLVVADVQRGGPSTGLPTRAEQSDLFLAAFSAHGDVVRPVLAPVDAADVFRMTVESFNLAEEFQTPVILLSDQNLGQRKESFAPIDTQSLRVAERLRPASDSKTANDAASGNGNGERIEYRRFRLTDNGVSPLGAPGEAAGVYQVGGIEHGENARPNVSGPNHAAMTQKRLAKFDPLHDPRVLAERGLYERFGPENAEELWIAWGSIAGAAREAFESLESPGGPDAPHASGSPKASVALLIPKLLYPVAEALYSESLQGARRALVIEQNAQGQLYRMIRMFVDLPPGLALHSLARPAGSPLRAPEILAARAEFTQTTAR